MYRILEKYLETFPPILFFCSDDITSMHFILSIKHLSDAQQEELVELMQHCGAELSFNVEDATDHSALIVDHDEVVNVTAPAFTIKYIEECLSKLKVLDISDYRQKATRHLAKNIECMEVVYYRKQSWDSVLTKAEKQWFETRFGSSRPVESLESQAAANCDDILSLVNGRLGVCEHKDAKPGEENHKTTNECRLSSDEDSDVEETEKTKNIKKNSTLENEKSRNPKATKESTISLCKSLGSKSKSGTAVDSGKKQIVSSTPSTSKWSFLDEFHQESSDEENVQPKAKEKEKKKKFFEFDAANEDLFKPRKDKKRSRMPYSFEEQSKILKYIVGHCEYSRIKGRELWMIMERRKVCSNRTWQSMKEHFVKKIAYNLEAFEFLTQSDKTKIKQIMF